MSDPKNLKGGNGTGDAAPRIGVYVCHCGTNIAGKVDTAAVAKAAGALPGVVVARDYKFLCSDPGQELVIKDIRELKLTRVVIASCSPRMHEPTFRSACARADLNPYLMTMANIREHCSWVTADPRAATEKAMALVRGAVARAHRLEPLETRESPVNPATLVIGGGIAGIQAALEIAKAGRPVYMVEKDSSIGGHMARFDKTFPTLDCAACILTPKMVNVAQSKNITLMTYAEVESVSGYIGQFKVKIRRKARLVDETKCNGCGLCWGVCPASVVPVQRAVMLGDTAIPAPATPVAAEPPQRTTKAGGVGATLAKIKQDYEKRKADHKKEASAEDCDLCGLCLRVCREVVGANVLAIEKQADGTRVIAAKSPERCIQCGACAGVCHTEHLRVAPADGAQIRHNELLLGTNTAIALSFMQAVPPVPVIDRASCIHFRTGGCTACRDVCEKQAIDYAQQDSFVEIEVGSIIAATGFKPFDAAKLHQYGYGTLPNVVTALEFEKLNNASGPTGGRILMHNGQPPESVALIHCVGSRDKNHHDYCSRVCCMMALKNAHLIHEKTGAAVYDFYIDMRCFGKGYEEFYNRLLEEGVFFIRGRAAEITDFAVHDGEQGKLIVRCEDTLIGAVRRIPVDMVVLMTGLEPADGAAELQRQLTLSRSRDGFYLEQHPKLAPVATPTDGIFIAGACQGPKDIPDTVAQAGAAACAALALSVRGKVAIEPVTCTVHDEHCAGCKLCNTMCPFSAITFDAQKKVSTINDAVCKGCGTCAAACPSGAIAARHFTDRQLLEEIAGVMA
ncbi:MAG TPA: 4Fe-4S binding protein [Polyangia bacterium]|jgi:heterodisulfide reductase subunit A